MTPPPAPNKLKPRGPDVFRSVPLTEVTADEVEHFQPSAPQRQHAESIPQPQETT